MSSDPYRTALDQIRDLEAGRVSSQELTTAAIARIEAHDGAINAVVERDFERALETARAADAALADGDRAPLFGLPMTVKESFNVAGLRTTWGMPWFRDSRAQSDAVAVERLRSAGAVILGKTNVPFALSDYQSSNEIYGTTNNPYALDRSPGGSSGGSAAALAAGFTSLELGSDIAGSLRVPAHFCGVCSHKPSRGVIPGRGHVPPGTAGTTPDLNVVGPLARTTADLQLLFDLLEGPDIIENTGISSLAPSRHEALSDFRVLVIDSHPLLPASEAVRGALHRIASELRSRGVRVETETPLLPDQRVLARAFTGLLMPVIFARRPESALAEMQAAAARLPADADTPEAWVLRAANATHRAWLGADEARTRLAYAMHELFKTYDVVLYPPAPVPAFVQYHGDDFATRELDIDGTPQPYNNFMYYAALATALGLPATTVPIGMSPEGLPVGMQIIGAFRNDRTTLKFAALIEAEFGGFTPPKAFAT